MSNTIVDSLVMMFGLDNKSFRKGADEVKKDLKDVKKETSDTSDELKKLGQGFVSFLGIITGGIGLKELISNLVDTNTQVERLSRNVGISASTISAWGGVVGRNGGTAEGFNGTLKSLSMQMTEIAVTGQSAVLPYMRALGIHLGDARGHARPLTDVLLDLADKLHALPRVQANNLGLMMGIDQGTLNTLLQGRQAFQGMLEDQKRLNPVTERQVRLSEQLSIAMNRSKESAKGLGNTIAEALEPYLIDFFEALTKIDVYLRQHPALIAAIGLALGSVLAPGLYKAARALWSLVGGFFALGAPVILATLVAISAALLVDDWMTWEKGGESALGAFWQAWANLWKSIKEGHLVRDALAGSLGIVGDVVAGVVKGDAHGGIIGAIKGGYRALTGRNPLAGSTSDAISYFEAQGWTHNQAAGLAANLAWESGLDPSRSGDQGAAYGIGQWHKDRQDEFKRKYGKNIRNSTFEEQLAFVQYELTAGNEQAAGNRLRGTSTATQAGGVVSRYYERPRDTFGEMLRRGSLAETAANQIAASSPNSYAFKGNSNHSAETNVGTINIHTQAKDADGIARDIGPAIKKHNLANQADGWN